MVETPVGEQRPADQRRDERRADLAFAVGVAGMLLLTALLYLWFPGIVAMLLLAALFSYALVPVVDRLDRNMPRSIAVLLVALLGVGLLALLIVLFTPSVAREIAALPEVVTKAAASLGEYWGKISGRLPGPVRRVIESTIESVRGGGRRATPSPETLTSWASGAASGVTAIASGIVFVPIFVFLMLRSYHSFIDKVGKVVPPRWMPRFSARMHQADVVLSGFIRGQLLVATLLAVIYGVSFAIIGIPLGMLIGILAGFGELVPFLGSIIAVVFGSLMALVGGNMLDLVWVLGVYLVVQAIQGAVISPLIMGSQVKVGPVAIIVALTVGAQLFGFLGMLLAVPAAALLKVATHAAFDAYRESPFFRNRAPA